MINLKVVSPTDTIIGPDGEPAGRYYAPALIEVTSPIMPEAVTAVRIGGVWYTPCEAIISGRLEEQFRTGKLFP